MSRLNFVIFGATGYTGKLVVSELALASKSYNFSWGIAGRSTDKLKQILKTVAVTTNIKLDNVETIEADLSNQNSIREMCAKAKILINCVGPYRYFGEQVIKECLTTKTHHLDMSGEPGFLESAQLRYNKEAVEKNVLVVGGCGFDSVIADIGVLYTKNNSPKEISLIESYLTLNSEKKYTINYATWESLIEGFSNIDTLKSNRKRIFKRVPKIKISLPKRANLLGYFYDQLIKKYCILFLGSDKSVVERTMLFYHRFKGEQKQFHYTPYMTINSFCSVLLIYCYGIMFSFLVKFRFGRYLLLKYYNFFSNGIISKSDYDTENKKDVTFRMEFRGFGLDKDMKLTKFITTEINGPEPAYLVASKIVVMCALVLLNESDKIPVSGGVITPGAAFINTTLIEKLQNEGVNFKITQTRSVEQKSNL